MLPLHATISRRSCLLAGGAGLFGLAVNGRPNTVAAASPHPAYQPKISSCILIFHYGGPSQLDTWDPKPHAPAEVRGEFEAISTSVPGIQVAEHLPRCAELAHRLAIVRTLHHPMRNHNSAAAETLTGRTPTGGDLDVLGDDGESFPCYGSTLKYTLGESGTTPAHVALPYTMFNVVQLPGQSAGFLGPKFERFQISGDPNDDNFRVPALELPADVTSDRFLRRQDLRTSLANESRRDASPRLHRSVDTNYDRAFRLLEDRSLRESVQLHRESDALRDRYGRNRLGQSVLLARRLSEAGVRFITVFDGERNCQTCNWDSHADNFNRHRDVLIPPADQALSALISDLHQRGRLDSTLVVSLGEFGRTPRINGAAGRDHWPDCFSAVFAGGGVRGGSVYGSSDAQAAYPDREPVSTGDLAATIYDRFGIDPATEMHDRTGRPHRLALGNPLTRIFES